MMKFGGVLLAGDFGKKKMGKGFDEFSFSNQVKEWFKEGGHVFNWN